MEFLRAGSDVMQTFTFSASDDNMESQVDYSVVRGWGGVGRGVICNKNSLLKRIHGTDLMRYYALLQIPPHRIFIK